MEQIEVIATYNVENIIVHLGKIYGLLNKGNESVYVDTKSFADFIGISNLEFQDYIQLRFKTLQSICFYIDESGRSIKVFEIGELKAFFKEIDILVIDKATVQEKIKVLFDFLAQIKIYVKGR